MVKNIEINKFLKEFEKEYNFLYDNRDNVAGYREALEKWNPFVENNKVFIKEFILYRGDLLTSDREIVAFMFAMEKYM